MLNFPRKPSGKQAGRLLLPPFLRDATVEILRLEYAVGVGRPEAAVGLGEDVSDNVASIVAEASPELRQRCRAHVLGFTLAPHAKWQPDMPQEDVPVVSVADLERQLKELADAGDRSAIVTLLAALDPARYGPPGRMTTAAADSVDGVDFTPVIK
jgi:hypothetical protein